VEVLRGSQGTLYGASSLGGVVRVLTKDANLSDFDFKGRASSSYTEDASANYRGDMAANLPIVPGVVAARVVVGAQDLSGWINDPVHQGINDAQLSNIRLKVNARPSENFSIGAQLWHSQGHYGAASVSDDSGMQTHTTGPEPIDDGFNTYSLTMGYNADAFTVSNSTSYLKYHNGSAYTAGVDPPYTVYDTSLESKNISDELQFSSTSRGAWRWSLGGNYRDVTDQTVQNAFLVNFFDTSRSYAMYGQLTRLLAEGRVELTGGLRYFHDDVETGDNPASFNPEPLLRKSTSYSKVSPQVSAAWHPNVDSSVYVSYTEGFRSGILQDTLVYKVAPDFPDVKPDTLKSYELGVKGAAANGRVLFEAAVYYMDWRDVQQQTGIPYSGFFIFAPVNVGKANGPGLDLGLQLEPLEGLNLGATFSWNDLAARTTVQSANVNLFNSGDRLNNSPKYTASGSIAYRCSIGRGFAAHFAAAANYTSPQYFRYPAGTTANISNGDAMLLARANIAIEAPQHWAMTGYVENLTDNRKRAVSNFGIPDLYGRVRPRTVGLEVDYKY
jgi:outer membrane receptor protein involved in Fe transport